MAAYAGQSVTGQITALDGTSVTLQIGELSQSDDMQPSDATPPEKPESDASGDTAAEDAGTQPSDATLPEKPEGDTTGETTEQTTGAQPSDMTLPDKPEVPCRTARRHRMPCRVGKHLLRALRR